MGRNKVIPQAANSVNEGEAAGRAGRAFKKNLRLLRVKVIGPDLQDGQRLIFSLGDLEWAQYANFELLDRIVAEMPSYKSFHVMACRLVAHYRNVGTGLDNLKFISECLSHDLSSEQKIQKTLLESLVQFCILTLFSFIFAFVFKTMMDDRLAIDHVEKFIVLAQIATVFLAFFILQKLRRRYFEDIDFWLNRLLQLEAWSMCGGNFAEEMGPLLNDLVQLQRGADLNPVAQRLFKSISRWHSLGGDLSPDIRRLLTILYQLRENRFSKFERSIRGVTFLLMVVLFLGGHFYQISRLFFTLLE